MGAALQVTTPTAPLARKGSLCPGLAGCWLLIGWGEQWPQQAKPVFSHSGGGQKPAGLEGTPRLGRLFKKSQCQPTQTFLSLHTMKVRGLSLFGKLRRHRLFPLEWRALQRLLPMGCTS